MARPRSKGVKRVLSNALHTCCKHTAGTCAISAEWQRDGPRSCLDTQVSSEPSRTLLLLQRVAGSATGSHAPPLLLQLPTALGHAANRAELPGSSQQGSGKAMDGRNDANTEVLHH